MAISRGFRRKGEYGLQDTVEFGTYADYVRMHKYLDKNPDENGEYQDYQTLSEKMVEVESGISQNQGAIEGLNNSLYGYDAVEEVDGVPITTHISGVLPNLQNYDLELRKIISNGSKKIDFTQEDDSNVIEWEVNIPEDDTSTLDVTGYWKYEVYLSVGTRDENRKMLPPVTIIEDEENLSFVSFNYLQRTEDSTVQKYIVQFDLEKTKKVEVNNPLKTIYTIKLENQITYNDSPLPKDEEEEEAAAAESEKITIQFEKVYGYTAPLVIQGAE